MVRWMAARRKNLPTVDVVKSLDYLNDPALPRSDVLQIFYADGTKLVIRPSGTEPKIKIYAEGPDIELCKRHVSMVSI